MDPTIIQSMRSELEKQALGAPQQPGKIESKLPWYSSAGGGMLGHAAGDALAKKFLPKKLQLVGRLAGTLAGTGIGLEGGTALGKRMDKTASHRLSGVTDRRWIDQYDRNREKYAEQETKSTHPAVTLAKSLAGFGAGMGAGFLATKGVNAALKKTTGMEIPPGIATTAIPIATGLGGLAYTTAQQRTLDKMRKDHLDRKASK